MKKSLIFLPVVALALTACNNTEDLVFEGSAAERLEQSKADAKSALTADGGLWSMEYFANSDEPGYVMLFRFSDNGSVEISGDHKWIGGKFTQETSLWDVVSDDGTVLTFNTYNKVFHIFSTPENIVGPDAPTNPETGDDINELGYGHNGDYEFQVMSHDADHVRLVGKKRGYNIYLRHLPADTDMKAYLEGVHAKSNVFGAKFNDLIMTDEAGNQYQISDLSTGIPSVFPLAGDAVSQTTKANGIFTETGFRFATHLTVKRPDNSEWELTELKWNEDGTLSNGAVHVVAPSPVANFIRQDLKWVVDKESMTGQFAEAYKAADDAVKEMFGANKSIGVIDFSYTRNDNVMQPCIATRPAGKICRDFLSYNGAETGTEITVSYVSSNSTADRYNKEIPEYWAFKQLLFNDLKFENLDPINPASIRVSLASDPESHFEIALSN